MRVVRSLFNEFINLLFSITIAVVLFLIIKSYLVQPFQVEGHSMDLTLKDGSQMLLLKQTKIDRFDIVVFPDPMGSGQSYVKRLIGLPGDSLYVKDDVLYINNQPTAEPYLEPLKSQTEGIFTQDFSLWDTIGEEVIPEGYYFVLGDNRPASGDSRQFGLVLIESIQGETSIVYFPFNQIKKLDHYQLDASGQVVVK